MTLGWCWVLGAGLKHVALPSSLTEIKVTRLTRLEKILQNHRTSRLELRNTMRKP